MRSLPRALLLALLVPLAQPPLGAASAFGVQLAGKSRAKPRAKPRPKPRRLLLAVGISDFADDHWPRLRFAGKDASDMAAFFKDRARPAFDRVNLVDDHHEPVTRTRIEAQLDRLRAANISPADIVIVYISGHGTIDWQAAAGERQLARYIVTADTKVKDVAGTALSFQRLLAAFRSLKSRKKALILDFCHSGTGKSTLTPEILMSMAERKGGYFPAIADEEVAGEYILAASSWRQTASESAQLQNGIYTHFLLKGFEQDQNNDGGVSLLEAHSYARAETAKFSQYAQTPTARVQLEGTDPIWINALAETRLASAQLFSLFTDYRVLVDGRDLGRVGKGMALPPGKHRVTLLHPDTLAVSADRVQRFLPGREYRAQQLLAAQPRHRLSLGLAQRGYLGTKVREQFAPGIETGPALRYVQPLGFWDLSVQASQLSARTTIAGIDQHRRSDLIGLGLGIEEDLGRTGSGGLWAQHWAGSLHLGPIWQSLRLRAESIGRDDQKAVLGMHIAAALSLALPRPGLVVGMELAFIATASPFAGERGPVTSAMAQVFVGAIW